jgi:hypothetical protein
MEKMEEISRNLRNLRWVTLSKCNANVTHTKVQKLFPEACVSINNVWEELGRLGNQSNILCSVSPAKNSFARVTSNGIIELYHIICSQLQLSEINFEYEGIPVGIALDGVFLVLGINSLFGNLL